MAINAGMASSVVNQLIFVTGRSINAPTNTNAGAVAIAGTMLSKGARKRKGRKRNAATTAVKPVRPPSSIPTADSI